ncbi:MAG: type II secretion system protein [Alphaproteobacteria bacterium]|nr:type II secretion system protein [Alphaproteobacteria bacterium]
MKNKNKEFELQSGRSMIEMLGVLAIVGVLSVGALSGYSAAMANHKANEAVEEIKRIIIGVEDLYADKPNYDGLTTALLQNYGVLPSKNEYGYPIYSFPLSKLERSIIGTPNAPPVFVLQYPISNELACKKIITSPWFENNKHRIMVTAYSPLPPGTPIRIDITDSLSTILNKCTEATELNMYAFRSDTLY